MTDPSVLTTSLHRDPGALAHARTWFTAPDRIPVYVEFARRYSELPRELFHEVAIALVRTPVRTVLDIGCHPGPPRLDRLQASLPEARLTVRPHFSEPGFAEVGEKFDLVLGYSMLRLCDDPVEALRHVRRLLAPGGLAYLIDFRRDVPPDTREHLLGRVEGDACREFLAAQLDAAFSLAEVEAAVEAAGVRSYRLGAGGLAGYPFSGADAYALLKRNDELSRILFRLPGYGLRSARAADMVFHLFIHHATENDDAA